MPLVEKHRGTILKFIGDAILASFESAVAASACALEIQEGFFEYNQDKENNRQIWIHIGDVLLKDNDVFGDGVNVAARLEPLAEPGGIVISSTVRDTIQASNKFKLLSMGNLDLKNIQYPVEGFRPITPVTKDLPVDSAQKRRNQNPPPDTNQVNPVYASFWSKFGFFTFTCLVGLFASIGIREYQKPESRKKIYRYSKTSQNPNQGSLSLKVEDDLRTSDKSLIEITLKMDKAPIAMLIPMICKIAKVQCMMDDQLDGTLSVDYKGVTFDQVLEDLKILDHYKITHKQDRYIFQNAKDITQNKKTGFSR